MRRAIDACMTVLLLLLMAYQVTGEVLHEWIGMGMTTLSCDMQEKEDYKNCLTKDNRV